MLATLYLAMASAVGLHLEEAADISLEQSIQALEQLAASIERRTGEKPRIDDPTWAACTEGQRCLSDARARLGITELVLVRIYGGPLNLRVAAELNTLSESADIPKDPQKWGPLFDSLAAKLFPNAMPPLAEVPAKLEPPKESSSILPWVFAGTGALSLGGSLYFGLAAVSSKNELEQQPRGQGAYDDLDGDLSRNRLVSNIFLGTALLCTGAAVAFLLNE